MVVGDERSVEHSVAIAVEVVSHAVHVVSLRPLVEVLGRTVWTGNEVVIHQVLIVVGSRVTAYHTTGIVIDDVVVVLDVALHLRVAALVVSPEAVVNGPVACPVGNGTEALRLYAL